MIRTLLRDKFIADNAVFFVGSIVVAFLNYAFHPVMSRMMRAEDFGEVQALISLTYFSGVLLTVCGTIVVNITSNDKTCTSGKCRSLLLQIYKLAIYAVVLIAIGIVLASPYVARALQFDSAISFFPLILILLVGVPFTFYGSYMRGKGRFVDLSVANIIASGGKLILAVVFVLLGMHVFGVVSAFFCATAIALWYMLYKIGDAWKLHVREPLHFTSAMRAELSYGALIFFSLGYITFLYASDVLFVKYFFPPEEAGIYSGLATIARIIFFATASVAGVLLPSIKIADAQGKNQKIVKKALMITTAIGIGALSIFVICPSVVITVLIGTAYVPAAHLLPLAGGYIFLVSVTNVMYTYFLALRDRRLIVVSMCGFVCAMIALIVRHESIYEIITDYIAVTVLTLILLAGMFIVRKSNGTDVVDSSRADIN